MIDKDDFVMTANAVIAGALVAMIDAAREGIPMNEAIEAGIIPRFGSIVETLWTVTRPNVVMHEVDIRAEIGDDKRLPSPEIVKDLLLHYVVDEHNTLIAAFVHGTQKQGTVIDDDALAEVLGEEAKRILIGLGFKARKVNELIDLSSLGQVARTKKLVVKDIDAEVEQFREDMNSTLDRLLGGGDST